MLAALPDLKVLSKHRAPSYFVPSKMSDIDASARAALFLRHPRTADVVVRLPGLAPRMVMQRCSASMTTRTPSPGCRPLSTAVATWLVRCPAAAATREHVDHARKLGDAADATVLGRDVRDVRDPEERQQVVLAHGVERDGRER